MRTKRASDSPGTLSHSQLVDRAGAWLSNRGCGFVFTELHTCNASGEIPDALGFRQSYSILIECKSTRADFLGDKNKTFRKHPELGMGAFRFYMCPAGVITVQDLPPKWGLLWVYPGGRVVQQTGPVGNWWPGRKTRSWMFEEHSKENERHMMYSALRRLHLRGLLPQIYQPLNPKERR